MLVLPAVDAASAGGSAEGSGSAVVAFLALRRMLRRRAIVEDPAGAPAGADLLSAAGALLEDAPAVRLLAARAASMPESREPVKASPDTRGRR